MTNSNGTAAASSGRPRDNGESDLPSRVSVTTRARLHFGFFDPSGQGSQPFGSFGLGLDRPTTSLSLTRGRTLIVTGPEADRAEQYLAKLAALYDREPKYSLKVASAIPAHAGLGSGTQLALSVGSAFAKLEGLDISLKQIATALRRGRRSGIGLGSFASGGAVIDGGSREGPPTMLARADFPENWRVLLIFDDSTAGIHGQDELQAFATAPAFPDSESAKLKQRALHSALPALVSGRFDRFCDTVGDLQSVMGVYFAPFQGGAMVSEAVSAAAHWLRAEGYRGVGQSSWGPTGFAILPSEDDAQRIMDEAANRAELKSLRLEMAKGCNEGALIECS